MLIGAGVRAGGGPLRYLAGPLAHNVERNTWAQAGALRNLWAGSATVVGGVSIANKSGRPDGLRHPASWLMAPKSGGMSSRNLTEMTFGTLGLAVGGITTTGSASFTIDFATASGELISSGEGSASFTISTNAPLLTASLGGEGSASFTIGFNTPTLGAEAGMIGAASWSITCALTPYAIGNMEGSTVDNTVLTSDVIASAVWAKIIEAGFSAEEVLRIIAANAAGDGSGLENGSPEFMGIDGSTVRIAGTYVAGTRTVTTLDGG